MNKKGVSEIVAYVFLILIAMSLSILVYAWLKSYIIQPEKKCPDSLALIITNYSCSDRFYVSFRNKGLFDIDGFLLKYSSGSGLPINYLSREDGDFFFNGQKKLAPNENYTINYWFDGTITSIEVLPLRVIDEEPIICTNSRFKITLNNCVI